MKFALTRLVAVEDLGCVLTALKRFTKGALIAMTALILANSHNRQKRPLEKAGSCHGHHLGDDLEPLCRLT